MALDDFGSSDDTDSNSGSDSTSSNSSTSAGLGAFTGSTSSRGGGGGGGYSSRWNPKIDFGTPYILVAEDRQGNIYKHQDHLAILDSNMDWRRLDDHPDNEFRVIYKCQSRKAWLRFCNRAQDQLGTDPKELLEDDPEELYHLRQKVHYPRASKPDKSRDCRVCGVNSDEDGVSLMEIDLQKHRKVPVCASHTIEDLASEGLLQ